MFRYYPLCQLWLVRCIQSEPLQSLAILTMTAQHGALSRVASGTADASLGVDAIRPSGGCLRDGSSRPAGTTDRPPGAPSGRGGGRLPWRGPACHEKLNDYGWLGLLRGGRGVPPGRAGGSWVLGPPPTPAHPKMTPLQTYRRAGNRILSHAIFLRSAIGAPVRRSHTAIASA